MKKDRIVKCITLFAVWMCCSLIFGSGVMAQEAGTETLGVAYRGHVQDYGNYPGDGTWVASPKIIGTTGQSKRIEGFEIKLAGAIPAGMEMRYNVHVQNKGWLYDENDTTNWPKDGAYAGTRGESLRIEAVKIVLTDSAGKPVPGYSVMYRGHVQNVGDLPTDESQWISDGNQLGTVGSSQRLEALVVKIVKTQVEPVVYDKAGTFGPATGTQTIAGDVTVAADGAVLQNLVIQGNLTISEAVGDGTVTLNNVTVAGDTFVRGGGKNSIHINGGSYKNIVMEKTASGAVRIVATGVDGLDVVISEDATGETIILEGAFDSVAVNAPNMTVTTQGDTTIARMAVSEAGVGSTLNLGAQTTVDGLELDAKTSVTGQGTVKEAEVKSDGVSFEKAPEKQTVDPAVTVPPVVAPVVPPTPGGGGNYTPPVSVIGVSLPTDLTVGMAKDATLTAALEPTNATNKKLTWASKDETVATVDAAGKVTGVAEGSTDIVVTTVDGSFSDTCKVTVTYSFEVTNGTITGMNGNATSIEIPTAIGGVPITAIGDNAFKSNSSMTSVTIPSTVTTIGSSAFAGCINLNAVTFAAGSNLTSIGDNAFNSAGLGTALTLPDSVTTIGQGAFAYSTMTTIGLPANLTSISESMFKNCTSLTTITLPTTVQSIGSNAFLGCQKLTGIVIPEGVTAIPDGAFDGCWALASVTLPSHLTSIGTNGFYYCKALKTLTLPASLTTIGPQAFDVVGTPTEGTDSALVMTFEGNAPTLVAGNGSHFATGTTFEYYAGCTGFAGVNPWKETPRYTLVQLNARAITNTTIKGVTIPFNGETPVTVITADPQYTGTVSWKEKVSGDPVTTFNGSTAYTATITLTPTNGYTAAGIDFTVAGGQVTGSSAGIVTVDFAVSDQYRISADGTITAYSGSGGNLTIPASVNSIPVTGIGLNVFNANASLTAVTLPETLETIGNAAFKGCTALTGIVIPASVTNIGALAFDGTSLQTMTCRGESPTRGSNAIPTSTEIYYYADKATRFDVANWPGYQLEPILAAPVNLVLSSITTNSMTLSWTAVPEASGYQVYSGSAADAITTPIGTSAGSPYSLTGLESGTTYYFKVVAVDAYGASPGSLPIMETTLP